MDPRGAGAEEDADASGAVALPRRLDGRLEAVLAQCQLGQTVVPAVECRQPPIEYQVLEAGDGADMRVERGVVEGAGREPAAARSEGRKRRMLPRADAGSDAGVADTQGPQDWIRSGVSAWARPGRRHSASLPSARAGAPARRRGADRSAPSPPRY